MNSLLADLWNQASQSERLIEPLVDLVLEQDERYGKLLMWCLRNGKWPGTLLGMRPHFKSYWFVGYKTNAISDSEERCYNIAWGNGHVTAYRKTPLEAFNDLYKIMIKLGIEDLDQERG